MDTKKLVDKELQPLLDEIPVFGLGQRDIDEVRTHFAAMMDAAPSVNIENVSVKEIHILTDDGFQMRALMYNPENNGQKRPALLHIHGGGFVIGNPEMNDGRNQGIADEIGAVIVSIDYRLAPEHPAPRSVEDCYSGLKWLFDNTDKYDIDIDKIAIYGESGGGGLAAALAILARDRNEVSIIHQFLIYPMIDEKSALNENANPFTGEFIWTREDNYYGWKSILGFEPGSQKPSPYVAASSVASTEGLPPTYICVGSLDLFLDENIAYAQRLVRSGIPTEMHIYPSAYHGFDMFAPDTALSKQFEIDFRRALKKAFS